MIVKTAKNYGSDFIFADLPFSGTDRGIVKHFILNFKKGTILSRCQNTGVCIEYSPCRLKSIRNPLKEGVRVLLKVIM